MRSKHEALSGITVKTTLSVIVAVLAALVLISCAIAGKDAWRSYTAAARVAEVNAHADQLLKGLESIQLERGQTNTALQAPVAASGETRDLIQKRRSQGDAALGPALQQIAGSATAEGKKLIAEVEQAYERVKQLRRNADSALQSAKEQRDAELLKSWYPTVSDLLTRIQSLWTVASREISKEDAIVGELTMIKQSAFLMREYAGRERAVHAGNISAGRALSGEQQRDIAGWRDKTFVLAMTGDAKGASDITHIMMPQQADMLQPFLVRLGTLSAAAKAKAVHFGEMPAAGHNYTPTQLANIGAPPTYAGSTATARRSDLAPMRPAAPGTVVASQPSDLANAPALAPVRTTTLPPAAAPAAGLTPPQVDIGMPSPAATGHYDLPHVAADRRTVGTPVYHGDSSARRASSASDEEDCTRVKVPAVRATRHHRGKPATTRLVCKASGSKSSGSASSSRDKADEDCTTVRTTSKGNRHHKGRTTTKTVCKARSDDGASAKSAGKSGAHADEDCTTVKTAAKGRHHKGKATTKTVCKPRADDDATPSKASAGKSASHADEDCTTVRVCAKGRHGKATTKQVCKPRDADDSAAVKASSRSTRSASADEDCTPVKSTVKGRHGKSHSVTRTVCKPADDDKATARKGGKAASDDADDSSAKGRKATASAHKGKVSDDEDDSKASARGGRIYVQVAGGANKADMDKAWAGVKKKAPELMKGKSPSTTPLRATHRLMVGPFKDEAEAQAFVNKMSGKGLSGFVVKTSKGQKVEKVGGE